MNKAPLQHHLRIFEVIRDQIAAANDLEQDDPFVLDTASGECNLEEAIIRVIRESRARQAMADGMKALIEEMSARKKRLDDGAAKLKQVAHYAMCESGIKKIPAPDFTLSRRNVQASVQIVEPDKVPDHLCKIVKEPSKTKIKEAIEAGETFDFAFMNNGAEALFVTAR